MSKVFKEMSTKYLLTQILLSARESYDELMKFKAEDEGLSKVSEPDYEAALQEAYDRVIKMKE